MYWRDRQYRPRAYNASGHAHELTFSCFHRFAFLSRDRTCEWLAESICSAANELENGVWAYVFMPDHVHLIVCPQKSKYSDSKFLKRVKEPVSRSAVQFLKHEAPDWLNRIRVRRGKRLEHHFWQPGRGFDRNITQNRTLREMIDSIHLNPVRKGFVAAAREWKWSSAGWFEGQPMNELCPDAVPPEWLHET